MAVLPWPIIFHASHRIPCKAHLKDSVDQLSFRKVLERSKEESPLHSRSDVRDQYNETRVQIHLAKEPDEVGPVVGHECKLVLLDPLSQGPIRLAVQAEVVDVNRINTSGMGYAHQSFVEAFVNKEPHRTSVWQIAGPALKKVC